MAILTGYGPAVGAYLLALHPGKGEARGDGLGNYWIEGWDEEADGQAPTPEQVAAWRPSPVPAVAAALAAREQIASATITNLKATAAVALVMAGMSEAEAYGAGTGLVVQHAALIQAYILAGGNAAAGQALIDAIEVSPPGWWGQHLRALFEAALV